MARQKLNDIVSYIETKLATNTDFDTVKYTDFDSQPIPVRTYGAHIYLLDEEGAKTDERRHLGPLLTEIYRIGVDIIINKRYADRTSVSDAKGISYWLDTIEALFLNQTNSGAFKDSYWEFTGLEPDEDVYTIKGILVVEILNNYA